MSGIVSKDEEGKMTCVSIVSLCADKNVLQFSVRDGLIGVSTHVDPTLMCLDRRVGQVLGLKDSLPHDLWR